MVKKWKIELKFTSSDETKTLEDIMKYVFTEQEIDRIKTYATIFKELN